MNYYSVPSDFKNSTIDFYYELNNNYTSSCIKETYGNLTVNNNVESGRPVKVLPKVSLIELESFVYYSQKRGIDFNYTMNAINIDYKTLSEKGLKDMISFIYDLYNIGINSFTVSAPSLIELFNDLGLPVTIKASTLCQATNANKASMIQELGVSRIVVDESINRDFGNLKSIVNCFNGSVELIVNAICHKNCVYRMFHYNQMSLNSIHEGNNILESYYPHRCLLQRYSQVHELLKLAWIRPEDIHYYNEIGINHFKLQGRQAVIKGNPNKTIKAYFDNYYDGDLIDLLDMFDNRNSFKIKLDNRKLDGYIKPFFENDQFCKNNCNNCNYCSSYSPKCIDQEIAKEVIDESKKFYSGIDSYKQLIKNLKNKNTFKEMNFAKNIFPDNDDFLL